MNLSLNSHCTYLISIAHKLVGLLPDRDLQAAFLFGSAAWGDADAASDLDIMLLVDRPVAYREVTRIYLADLFGRPLENGPTFADLDRISTKRFVEALTAGFWGNRVTHSIILLDTDHFYADLRAKVSTAYLQPSARHARSLARQRQAEEARTTALKLLDKDPMLAALHARLGLQDAGTALIELNGNRFSSSHFVEHLEQALSDFNSHLFARCVATLSLDTTDKAVERSLHAYDALAQVLKQWIDDPSVSNRLSQEQLAWAKFTYGKQTHDEIAQKVVTFTQARRLPTLLYYLNSMLQIPMRIQISKIFLLRSGEGAERMSIPDFQIALHQEPTLYNEWTTALRLSDKQDHLLQTTNIISQLLAVDK